jgi:hypothetical protein
MDKENVIYIYIYICIIYIYIYIYVLYIYKMGYYSASKKEILSFAASWTELEVVK